MLRSQVQVLDRPPFLLWLFNLVDTFLSYLCLLTEYFFNINDMSPNMGVDVLRRKVLLGGGAALLVAACGGDPREGASDVESDVKNDVESSRQRFENFFDEVRGLREQIRAFEDLQEIPDEAVAQVCAIAEQIRDLVLAYIADVDWELHPDQGRKPETLGMPGVPDVTIGESQLLIPEGTIPDSDAPFGVVATIDDKLPADLQKEFRLRFFLGGDIPFGNVIAVESVVDSGDSNNKPLHTALRFDVKFQDDTNLQFKYAYEDNKGPKVWMRTGSNGAQTLVNAAECKDFKGKDLHDATTVVKEVVESLVEEFPEK